MINLIEERKQAKERLRTYCYLQKALHEAETLCNTKKMKLHRETFLKYMCEHNDIDFNEFKETAQFISDYIYDHPEKYKFNPKN